MAQIKEGLTHGLWKILIQKTGSGGESFGTGGASITNGTTTQAFVMDKPKTAGLPAPDATVINFTGGDVWITNFMYGINDLGSFDITDAKNDATLNALVTGTTTDQTTNVQWTQYTEDYLQTAFTQVSIIMIYRIQSTETGTFNTTKWFHRIIPRALMRPKPQPQSYQSPSEMIYQVTPQTATKRINGETLTAMNPSASQILSYNVITDNPIYMFCARANSSSLSAISAYKPVSSSVGTTTDSKTRVVKIAQASGGAVTVGVADSVNVTTGAIAVGTALTVASGDFVLFMHETDYTAV